MFSDFWRIAAAAAIGLACAAALAIENLRAGQPLAAAGWVLAWLGCAALLALPAALRSRAERRNPPH
jgi:hypothetical protein